MSPEPRPRWLDQPQFTLQLALVALLIVSMLGIVMIGVIATDDDHKGLLEPRIMDLTPRPWVLGVMKERNNVIDHAESYDKCMIKKEQFLTQIPDKQKVRYIMAIGCWYDPEKWKQRNLGE